MMQRINFHIITNYTSNNVNNVNNNNYNNNVPKI